MSEQNAYLNIMLDDLSTFKAQKNKKILKNIKDIDSSTNYLYSFLEKYLHEINYIIDKTKKEERIRKIYNWYKEKKQLEKDIKTITYKSYKDNNEVYEKEYLLMKQENIYNELDNDEINHRNYELINKKMLAEYQRKKLSKPYWALKKSILSQTIPTQSNNNSLLSSTTNYTLNNNNTFEKGDITSLYSISKGTNISTKKKSLVESNTFIDKPNGGYIEKNDKYSQNFADNIYLPLLKKENKYSYSYSRSISDLNDIYMENKIIQEKNKVLALKRSQEEIKEKIKLFGLYRSKFKQNLMNKYEIKNLLNLYINQNKNNFSSNLLQKYKIKEKDEENKDTLDTKSLDKSKVNSPENNKDRKIIKFRKNNFKSEKNLIAKINEEDPNYTNSNIKSESSENNDFQLVRTYSNNPKLNNSLSPKVNLFELSEEKNKANKENYEKMHKSSKFLLSRKLSIKKSKKTMIQKKPFEIFKYLPVMKLFKKHDDKIRISKIKNIEDDTKKIKESNEIDIKDYKIKLPKEKINTELTDKNLKENNSDSLPKLISNDPLFKGKLNYQEICKINTNINPTNTNINNEENNINNDTKWVLLNKDNVEEVNKQILMKIRKRNKFEKLSNRYNSYKNNLLSMRLSMSIDKKKEYQNLADKIKLKKLNDYEFNDDNYITESETLKTNSLMNYRFKGKSTKGNKDDPLLLALVNPKDYSNYSRFFLPRNGSMLLSRDKAKKFIYII